MNEHDSENIAGLLEAMGYEHIDDPYKADVTVINTCSVRENADKRFFGTLGQFKKVRKNNPDFVLAVCGCMPQQPRVVEEINKRFAWVDIVFGTQNIAQFPELLEERLKTGRRMRAVIANNPDISEDGMKPVRMQDAEGHSFADLIKAVNDIEGIERIRFMTSHPKDISDEMIECFTTCDKLCHNIHLPVQSGSDRILKRMNRHYNRESYLETVDKLRRTAPDITISTDIIVGFPGETDEDFEETLDIARKVEYDSAFTFIYSPREGTPAAKFADQVPDDVCHERFDRLVDVMNEISLKKNLAYKGRICEVIAEGVSRSDDNVLAGRTDGFKLVNFTSDRSPEQLMGRKVLVEITESKTFSLEGREVK